MSAGPVRTVFLGSGEFAVPTLAALAEHPSVELVGVVSAPPRPVGRRQQMTPTPVGRWAVEHGFLEPGQVARARPVLLTPASLRATDSIDAIAALEPALLVLADYGQIVPQALLDLPAHGALNLHPSLLPRHRGAAPIQSAILAGDERTGVTLMVMDAGLDSGPVVAQHELALHGAETAPELEAILAAHAAGLLAEVLPGWLSGEIEAQAQPSEGVTMTRPLKRADGRLDPHRPAQQLERQVRALQPWPGSYVELPGGRLQVWSARVADPTPGRAPAGELVALDGGRPALATLDGSLELVEVQPAGGRRMSGAELLRGRPGLVTVR